MLNITNIESVRAFLALAREVRASLPSLPGNWAKLLPWASAATPWPLIVGAYGAGVATGAGAALLFAPMSGKDLRSLVKKRTAAVRSKVPQRVREMSEKVSERARETLARADVVVATAVKEAVVTANASSDEGASDEAVDNEDLAELTREELYARAQEEDIPGRSKMDKDELVAALRRA